MFVYSVSVSDDLVVSMAVCTGTYMMPRSSGSQMQRTGTCGYH